MNDPWFMYTTPFLSYSIDILIIVETTSCLFMTFLYIINIVLVELCILKSYVELFKIGGLY